MLLLVLTVSGVLFVKGSAASVRTQKVCYGKSWNIPSEYLNLMRDELIYLTPSNGGARKVVMKKGKAVDPRFKVSPSSINFTDVTKQDEGLFSVVFNPSREFELVKLKVLDCAEEVTRDYGSMWNYPVPAQAEFLEFTPLHSVDQPKILWNRTDAQNRGSRGQVKEDVWEMSYLTQADNGYYNFRQKDNSVFVRILLKVQELTRYYDAKENVGFLVRYPPYINNWTVTFTLQGEMKPITFIKGSVIMKDNWFFGRIHALTNGIEIDRVKNTDTGTFKFRDTKGNLALTAHVEVIEEDSLVLKPLIIALAVGMGIFCCCYCCVKKCCVTEKSEPETAAEDQTAPAVHSHNENQPTCPSYTDEPPPYHPGNFHVSKEPTATFIAPPANHCVNIHENPSQPEENHGVNIHENPSQPEVALPSSQGSTSAPSVDLDFLSSEPVPQFELKGLTFPSAPPLSSDPACSNFYSSEKLNFL